MRFLPVMLSAVSLSLLLIGCGQSKHRPIDVYLTVESEYGSPTPSIGSNHLYWGMTITASVDAVLPDSSDTCYGCTGWSGTGSVPASGSTNSFTFRITQNSSVTWEWGTFYLLTVDSPYGSPEGEGWYDEGTSAAWSVTSPCPGEPGVQYIADQASGTVIMDAPRTVTLTWTSQYRLTTAANPAAGGSITPSGETYHNENALVTATAIANPGYVFTNWSGDLSGNSNPETLTMDEPRSVTANFHPMIDSMVRGWAVIVGINDYPGSLNDLNFCVADAVDFKNRLLEDTQRWSADHITFLQDSDATGTNIHYAIQNAISSAGLDDGIVFFYSGHGTSFTDTNGDETDGVDEALYVYDGSLSDDTFGSWFSGADTDKILIILDSCFSGGMFKADQRTENNFRIKGIGPPRTAKGDGFAADLMNPVRNLRSKDLDELPSVVVLTACDDDETCAEDYYLQHGVFTYFVLQALDSLQPDYGVISAEEVYEYAAPLATEYMSDQHAQLYDSFPEYLLGFVAP